MPETGATIPDDDSEIVCIPYTSTIDVSTQAMRTLPPVRAVQTASAAEYDLLLNIPLVYDIREAPLVHRTRRIWGS